MNRVYKIYLILFGVILALIILLEMSKTKVVNWSLNYDINEKSPFGLYIFNQEADALFDNKLKRIDENPYFYLEKEAFREPQNYISIEKSYTNEGYNYLLKEVERGSNAFIISSNRHYYLSDSLGFDTNYEYNTQDSLIFRFTDKKLQNDTLTIVKNFGGHFFNNIDTKTTQILAYSEERNQNDTIKKGKFIQVSYGKGKFYFLTQPLILTNFYLKEKKNQKVIQDLFSYLPKRETVWFQDKTVTLSQSDMRFILENRPLRYVWYIILFGLVTFMFFNAKRRQRIIPIIQPPVNKSVEFVKNIGNLYLQEGNDKDMAQKKNVYFLNKVRNDLYLNTDTLDEEFAKKLQIKTGKNKEDIDKAIQLMKKAMNEQTLFYQKELVELNELLDKIYS